MLETLRLRAGFAFVMLDLEREETYTSNILVWAICGCATSVYLVGRRYHSSEAHDPRPKWRSVLRVYLEVPTVFP